MVHQLILMNHLEVHSRLPEPQRAYYFNPRTHLRVHQLILRNHLEVHSRLLEPQRVH
jgi:hypothetical protein